MANYYSVSQLVRLRLPGYPTSREGWYRKVESENWPAREVRGKGGPKGTRAEYQPPPDVQRQIDELQGAPATGSGERAPRVQSGVADYRVTDAAPRAAPRGDLRDLPQVLVEDDAMEPLIPNGWWGLIEWTRDKPDQAGIYAMLLDGKLAVRRLEPAADGGLVLTCENPTYPGRTLSPEDASKLMVFGRVVFVGRPL